jgi:hypothetical protein
MKKSLFLKQCRECEFEKWKLKYCTIMRNKYRLISRWEWKIRASLKVICHFRQALRSLITKQGIYRTDWNVFRKIRES